MKDELTLTVILPVPPQRVYCDWLDSAAHSALTGSPALIDARVGGEFSAWDGYIRGKTLELDPGQRVLQSWRTSDFPPSAPDSLIEVTFKATPAGTEMTIHHTRIPPGQVEDYARGWEEYYFQPMRAGYTQRDCADK